MAHEIDLPINQKIIKTPDIHIDKIIEHNLMELVNNEHKVSRLFIDSVSCLAASKSRVKSLSEQKTINRFINDISGKNKKIQNAINNDLSYAQKAAQKILQLTAENNLLTRDVIISVNNKLNSHIYKSQQFNNQVYEELVFYLDKLIEQKEFNNELDNRVNTNEKKVDLLLWIKSIEYKTIKTGNEFISDFVQIINSFYTKTEGLISDQNYSILKGLFKTLCLLDKKITYKDFLFSFISKKELTQTFLFGINYIELTELNVFEELLLKSIIRIKHMHQEFYDEMTMREEIEEYFNEYSCDLNYELDIIDFSEEILSLYSLIEREVEDFFKDINNTPISYYNENLELIYKNLGSADENFITTLLSNNVHFKEELQFILNKKNFKVFLDSLRSDEYCYKLLYFALNKAENGDFFYIDVILNTNSSLLEYEIEHTKAINIFLLWSTRYAKIDIVKLLLSKGADINSIHYGSRSVLNFAVQSGNIVLLKYLQSKTCTKGDIPLMFDSYMSKSLDMVKLFNKPSELISTDYLGMSHLHFAVLSGNIGIVKYVLKYYKNVNAKNEKIIEYQKTPLSIAFHEGYLEIIELLIENGANLEKDLDKYIRWTLEYGHTEVLQFLIDKGVELNYTYQNGYRSIHYAVSGNKKTFKLFLSKCNNIHEKTANGEQPIHLAAENRDISILKILIENGANVNSITEEGKTPIFYAIKSSCYDGLKLLYKNGADLNREDRFGNLPIHISCNNWFVPYRYDYNTDILKFLIQNGSDLTHRNKKGLQPIHFSIKNKNIVIFRLLLDFYIKNKILKVLENEYFFYAAMNGSPQIIEEFVLLGIDINQVDFDGNTALYHSLKADGLDNTKKVLSLGGDINYKNLSGNTIVDSIIKENNDYNFSYNSELITWFIKNGALKGSETKYSLGELRAALTDSDINELKEEGILLL